MLRIPLFRGKFQGPPLFPHQTQGSRLSRVQPSTPPRPPGAAPILQRPPPPPRPRGDRTRTRPAPPPSRSRAVRATPGAGAAVPRHPTSPSRSLDPRGPRGGEEQRAAPRPPRGRSLPGLLPSGGPRAPPAAGPPRPPPARSSLLARSASAAQTFLRPRLPRQPPAHPTHGRPAAGALTPPPGPLAAPWRPARPPPHLRPRSRGAPAAPRAGRSPAPASAAPSAGCGASGARRRRRGPRAPSRPPPGPRRRTTRPGRPRAKAEVRRGRRPGGGRGVSAGVRGRRGRVSPEALMLGQRGPGAQAAPFGAVPRLSLAPLRASRGAPSSRAGSPLSLQVQAV